MTVQLGREFITGPDGAFEFDGVVLGSTTLMVTSEGYGMVNFVADGQVAGDAIQLPDLPLTRKEHLTVELRSTAQEDFSRYRLEVDLQDWAPPPRDFDAAGRADVPAITPGRVTIAVSSEDGVYLMTTAFEAPGRAARRVLELDPSTTLAVRARAGEHALVEQSQLILSYAGVDGRQVESYAVERASGEWFFSSVPTRHGTLTLSSPDGIVCAMPVSLSAGANEVELALPDEPLELRVVDVDGAAVSGAIVRLDSDAHPGWAPYALTNADGRVRIPVANIANLRASIFSESVGVAADLPVGRPRNGETAVELVLDTSCKLELALRDGSTPLAAVKFHLFNSATTLDYGDWISNGDGVVELPRVMRGSGYRAVLDQPGLWRTIASVTVDARRTKAIVDVRRTGEIEITVERAGAPVAGVAVALRSIEFGVDVAQWLAAERIECPQGELRTNAEGRLLLRGLPRGDYDLACDGLSHRVAVPPRARVVEKLVLR